MSAKRRQKGSNRAQKVQKRRARRAHKPEPSARIAHDASAPPLPDRRLMEQVMRQLVPGVREGCDDLSAAAAAQALVYQAVESDDDEECVRLAQKALAICPDCADAYVLLAESTDSIDEAIRLYAEGVAAGRRALGEDFEELVGHFWGYLDSRPYMRAKAGLAETLWYAGRQDESLAHDKEMLRLNPNDNQGIRYRLLQALIELDRDAEANALLETYSKDSAADWIYSRALLAFRREGDSARARKLIAAAQKGNPHVVTYLLGEKPFPSQLPEYVGIGDESEAASYVSQALSSWKATPGAIAWLRKNSELSPHRQEDKSDVAELPHVPSLKTLLAVPKDRDQVWQVGCRRLAFPFQDGQRRQQLWFMLVVERGSEHVIATHIRTEPADADTLQRLVAQAVVHPEAGTRRRPERIEVACADDKQGLAPLLDRLGVDCVVKQPLELVELLIDDFEKSLSVEPPSITGLLEIPDVTQKEACRFFEAAAAFFRRRPWRHVAADRVFRVEAPNTGRDPWSGIVMGQSGIELGFALYDNAEFLTNLLGGKIGNKEAAGSCAAISVTFGEEDKLSPADIEAIEQFGWPVATPEAYPLALRVDPGPRMRSPEAWEIDLLTQCLEAIPDFLATAGKKSSSPAQAAGGLLLSWVDD